MSAVLGEKELSPRFSCEDRSLLFHFIFPFFLASSPRSLLFIFYFNFFFFYIFYQGGDEGKTWERKGMLSTGLMAMLSGPAIFIGIGVVIATGWAIFIGAVAGMFTEAMLTGPVMVTGCWRLTGDVMLTVLVLMFICAAMVTGLLLFALPRFIAEVMGAEMVTGVAEAELQTSLPSGETQEQAFYLALQHLAKTKTK